MDQQLKGVNPRYRVRDNEPSLLQAENGQEPTQYPIQNVVRSSHKWYRLQSKHPYFTIASAKYDSCGLLGVKTTNHAEAVTMQTFRIYNRPTIVHQNNWKTAGSDKNIPGHNASSSTYDNVSLETEEDPTTPGHMQTDAATEPANESEATTHLLACDNVDYDCTLKVKSVCTEKPRHCTDVSRSMRITNEFQTYDLQASRLDNKRLIYVRYVFNSHLDNIQHHSFNQWIHTTWANVEISETLIAEETLLDGWVEDLS
ncbi:hypothetical protein CLF_103577 [Clonorchis sinensis]|uniref:Uncharacterized protein n=1 Tax=Clonorchis sinensis TaxID=79923 RepID=G7Y9Y7_CLOSI|nr:hypothetical protein CLF_103577 [Clonorchis sinensis]